MLNKSEFLKIRERMSETSKLLDVVINSNSVSDNTINNNIDNLIYGMENLCIDTRLAVERCRPIIPINNRVKKNCNISGVAGNIEVTPEGWTHIVLNTLIPHVRYKISSYFNDTIIRIVDGYDGTLPRYGHAFLAIVELCSHTNRNAFDSDNKGWKIIPNVLKGRLFQDDNQFELSLGLFSKLSDESMCHIFVMPIEGAVGFMFCLKTNIWFYKIISYTVAQLCSINESKK